MLTTLQKQWMLHEVSNHSLSSWMLHDFRSNLVWAKAGGPSTRIMLGTGLKFRRGSFFNSFKHMISITISWFITRLPEWKWMFKDCYSKHLIVSTAIPTAKFQHGIDQSGRVNFARCTFQLIIESIIIIYKVPFKLSWITEAGNIVKKYVQIMESYIVLYNTTSTCRKVALTGKKPCITKWIVWVLVTSI